MVKGEAARPDAHIRRGFKIFPPTSSCLRSLNYWVHLKLSSTFYHGLERVQSSEVSLNKTLYICCSSDQHLRKRSTYFSMALTWVKRRTEK